MKSTVAVEPSRPVKQEVLVSKVLAHCIYVGANVIIGIIDIEEATTGMIRELP